MIRAIRNVIRGTTVAAFLLMQIPLASAAQPLDQLLEQTRNSRQAEARINQERETKFLKEREQRAALLAEARQTVARERARSTQLTSAYETNEKQLAALQEQLDAKAGNLGEMFGVVRQVANDFSSVVHNSMISAQFPERDAFIAQLAQSKALPSIAELERFWFELQREMTESGKVVRFKTKYVEPAGTSAEGTVVRVGPFNATSDGDYLSYIPSEKRFAVMGRQPAGDLISPSYVEEATSGYVKTMVDPTRGVLLSIYAQRPGWWERIEKGEAVGYVILLVGAVGAGLLIYQLFYLATVRGRVRNQLKFPEHAVPDNPLGRVLVSFKGDASKLDEDTEVVELRISEAVLKEVPVLERYQSFLKLAVAAGPLLGLVGTVLGMIITFQSITESGSSDPKLMANGISQAMIATLLGLGIAVPLLFGNAWLASISRSIVQILEEQSTGLLAEYIERRKQAPPGAVNAV
jgi:biopolymer transport protein ExbB